MTEYKKEVIEQQQAQDRIEYTAKLLLDNNMPYHLRLLSRVFYPSTDRLPVFYGT